jgi:hypothetical protein
MNVEERLSLVRACTFQDEPTFLEGFHDAVETAVFCAGWCCESCCDSGARKLGEERTLYACVDDRFWRILLQKSAVTDGCRSVTSL